MNAARATVRVSEAARESATAYARLITFVEDWVAAGIGGAR